MLGCSSKENSEFGKINDSEKANISYESLSKLKKGKKPIQIK